MTLDLPTKLIAISDTGPLISIFQSDSLELLRELFHTVYTTATCLRELHDHGWDDVLEQVDHLLIELTLDDDEMQQAHHLASRIASRSKNKDLSAHRGEAEILVLGLRPEIAGGVIVVDEIIARSIAADMNFNVTGFAGILLIGARVGIVSADDVRSRLEQCRRQGTYYSPAFIERVYQRAKEG